jgi:hypothetical protein
VRLRPRRTSLARRPREHNLYGCRPYQAVSRRRAAPRKRWPEIDIACCGSHFAACGGPWHARVGADVR